ncbi:MAG: iron-sulfur cluster-binding domain-containing protein [Clostridia bacterium]|nr:iron-sulfur cluster-binding domain-containing protein [Clostridia bacterium]
MKKFNFHVKPIGLLDMLNFKKLVPNRTQALAEGSPERATASYEVNKLATYLHPKSQQAEITEIIEHGEIAKTFILSGKELAPFRAGQYLSVKLEIGKSILTRPFSISSSPKWVKEGKYALTIKRAPNGFASDWILENWKVGTKVSVSGPEGVFYYEPLRDSKNVVCIAGGSGITPFLSMAYAIRDGIEDFNMTILYGSCTENEILYKKELDQITENCDKVKVIHVLSKEQSSCYEFGFITSEIIEKYAEGEYSVFMCGPSVMYDFVGKELEKLSLKSKFIRREMLAAPSSPKKFKEYKGKIDKEFKLTVKRFGEVLIVPMKAEETVLIALERAGIAVPSKCRGGECGFCRSRLESGEIFTPDELDARRIADIKEGYIHPCCTYPLSDLVIEVWPEQGEQYEEKH